MSIRFCVVCGEALSKKRVKNPHNSKDEFCSQSCARQNRLDYLESGKKNYLLYAEGSPTLLGVFNSMESLLYGVQFQIEIHKFEKKDLGKLYYEIWLDNYPQGPTEWYYV